MAKIIEQRPNGRKRVATAPSIKPSRTQQQFAKDCDVNNIIAKYKRTGSVTHVRNQTQGVYANLENIPSYEQALQQIITANNAFNELPAETRARFGNDPEQLINFLKDEKNNEESYKLGLRERKPTPPADPVVEELKTLNQNITKSKKSSTD